MSDQEKRIKEIVKRMKMRNELMRATKHPHYADDIAENEIVIDILQERLQRERQEPEEPKELTELEIRSMKGEVIKVIRSTPFGKNDARKVVVDLFDYRDDHCLIIWGFNIRGGNLGLSAMERNCLLLPFSELGNTWLAYATEPKGEHHD